MPPNGGNTNGVGGKTRALEIARQKGGITLEGILDGKGVVMPEFSNNPELWKLVSAEYAKQASGEIRAIVGKVLRKDNFWENVELPRLKENINVTKITTIDPETLVETVIFKR